MNHHLPGRALVSLVALGLSALAPAAGAAVITLQNDGFTDGAAVGFQMGFVEGEGAAVTLGPVAAPFTVQKILFLFGGAATQQTVTLNIYEDTGALEPGTLLYTADYQVQGADDALQQIDLTAESVASAAGSIRVGFVFQHANLPSVARDTDGCTPDVNWVWGNLGAGLQWYEFCTIPLPGQKGDWIIRAEVETEGGTGGTGAAGTGGTGASAGTGGSAGTGASAMLCTPGQSIPCTGPGGCAGGQTCLADGSGYGPCQCSEGEDEGGCVLGASRRGEPPTPLAGFAVLGSLLLLGRARRRPRR